MPDRRDGNQKPAEHAKQQIRELGQAVKKAIKEVDKSSPNAQQGDRIIREFQQRVTEISQRRRQPALPSSQDRGASSEFFTSPFFLKLLVWIIWIGLFAIVTVSFGLWGVVALSFCWGTFLLLNWPVPDYLAVLHLVWLVFYMVSLYYSLKLREKAMTWYDERRSQHRHLCSVAFTFAQIAEQTIFAQITDRTTPEQFQAAQQNLTLLCRELEGTVEWDHYASASGPLHMPPSG
jgi:hypothetical protein